MMKKIIIVFICCLFAMNVFGTAIATKEPISLTEASQNVDNFIGKADESLKFRGIANLNHGEYYVFQGILSEFYVNTETGLTERASFNAARLESLVVRIDEKNALISARQFVEEKYPDFNNKSMRLVKSDLLQHGNGGKEYLFIWRESIDKIETPNLVVITQNPTSGEIISYIGINREITVPLESKIEKDKARIIAERQFSGIEVIQEESYLSIEYPYVGEQRLCWIFTIIGTPYNGVSQGGLVVIDAMNGDILMVSNYQ